MSGLLLSDLTEYDRTLLDEYEDPQYTKQEVLTIDQDNKPTRALAYVWTASTSLLGDVWQPSVHFEPTLESYTAMSLNFREEFEESRRASGGPV